MEVYVFGPTDKFNASVKADWLEFDPIEKDGLIYAGTVNHGIGRSKVKVTAPDGDSISYEGLQDPTEPVSDLAKLWIGKYLQPGMQLA